MNSPVSQSLTTKPLTVRRRFRRKLIIKLTIAFTLIGAVLGLVLGLYFSGGKERYAQSVRTSEIFTNLFVNHQLNAVTEAECTPTGWQDISRIYADLISADAANTPPRYEGEVAAAVADYSGGTGYQYVSAKFAPGTGKFAKWLKAVTFFVRDEKLTGVAYQNG